MINSITGSFFREEFLKPGDQCLLHGRLFLADQKVKLQETPAKIRRVNTYTIGYGWPAVLTIMPTSRLYVGPTTFPHSILGVSQRVE